jgi:hypothetical protein
MHAKLRLLQLLPVGAHRRPRPCSNTGGAEPLARGYLGERGREAVEVPWGVAFVALERVALVFAALGAGAGGLDVFRVTRQFREFVVGFREEEGGVLACGDAGRVC